MTDFENRGDLKEIVENTNKKRGLAFPHILLALVLVVIAFVSVFSITSILSHNTKKKDIKVEDNEILNLIDEKFLYSDEVDLGKIKNHDPDKMLEMLKDPYSEYLDRDELKILREELNGKFYGIGVKFSKNESGRLVVKEFIKGSSAEEQGIKVDDELMKIEGEDALAKDIKDFEKLIRKVRGEAGTAVNLEFYRPSTDETVSRRIPRKEVKVSSIEGKILEGGIGYIKVSEFIDSTDEDFEEEVNSLRNKGAKSFIIDLRDNPGGSVTTTTNMLDYILPKGKLLYSKNNRGVDRQWNSDEEKQMRENIVVLINENSASASEIFAGAMQDFGKAKIIGKKSFGKGIIQQIFPLKDGTAVKLTVSEYYTPKDQRINKRGVIPDIEVEKGTDSDTQLDRALEELKGQ